MTEQKKEIDMKALADAINQNCALKKEENKKKGEK